MTAVVVSSPPRGIAGVGGVRHRHLLNGGLEKIGWHGKTFVAVDDAYPLICRDEDGKLYPNLTGGKGAASLWLVELRGEPTATMVHERQHYYFLLVREVTPDGCDQLPGTAPEATTCRTRPASGFLSASARGTWSRQKRAGVPTSTLRARPSLSVR
ncbi:MAG: hypothetical protein JWR35_1990 [Marmoricola sp.]|nr:hypothetical protein [Marmoricola sp.]